MRSKMNSFLVVSEAGADDFEVEEDIYIITTPPDLLFQVKEAITRMGVKCE
jgi:transcriptional/translational regulatory protein YebC/TACO1